MPHHCTVCYQTSPLYSPVHTATMCGLADSHLLPSTTQRQAPTYTSCAPPQPCSPIPIPRPLSAGLPDGQAHAPTRRWMRRGVLLAITNHCIEEGDGHFRS